MFTTRQRVKVTNCMQLSGGPVWQGHEGVVRTIEAAKGKATWYMVKLDDVEGLIPFKERELSAADEDDAAKKDHVRSR